MTDVWIALGLTAFAGMSTAIGSAIAFTAERTNYRLLSVATGFSAGVMLYVSFVEIFHKGVDVLSTAYGAYWGQWIHLASFFGGLLLIGIVDNLIPAAENPHEVHAHDETAPLHSASAPLPDFDTIAQHPAEYSLSGLHDHRRHRRKLMRMGVFAATAIAIHNFPEGLATFVTALQDPNVGVAIAVAVALHNIPEGISVAVPIFYATGNRARAFVYSCLSGLAEPLGAIVAYVMLRLLTGGETGAIPSEVVGVLFGGVAGIMVYISLDQLLPTSRAYGRGHDSLLGLMAGMGVMAISLLLMS